jgi:hypothetical protein
LTSWPKKEKPSGRFRRSGAEIPIGLLGLQDDTFLGWCGGMSAELARQLSGCFSEQGLQKHEEREWIAAYERLLSALKTSQ